jgi:hypothetical protein
MRCAPPCYPAPARAAKPGIAGTRSYTMNHAWLDAALLCIAALLVGSPSQAEDLRCGDRLARPGTTLYEVRSICGEPDAADHNVETHTIRQRVQVPCPNGSEHRICEVVLEQTVEVVVDRWTYDFGSNRFIELARFENGSLVSVANGGYGHKEPS